MRKKTVIVAGIAAAGLAVGIVFPSLTAAVQDLRTGKREEALSSDSITLSMNSKLPIGQKMEIVDDYDSVVQLDAAQSLSAKEAKEKVYSDIQWIMDALGWELNEADLTVKEEQILLYMSSGAKTSGSVLTWHLTLQDKKGDQVEVWLDDETGQMVKLQALVPTLFLDGEAANTAYGYDQNFLETQMLVQTEVLASYLGEYYGYQYDGIFTQSYDSFDLHFSKNTDADQEEFDVSVTYAYDKISFND